MEVYFILPADVARKVFPHLAGEIKKDWELAIIRVVLPA